MKSTLLFAAVLLLATRASFAQDSSFPEAKVSFDDFKGLVAEVEAHRASRLVDLDTFLKISKDKRVIILDSRSGFRFNRVHIKGAKHLAFTDFTQASLAKVIPDPNTTILIYCNNNFDGNQKDFATKSVASPLRLDNPVPTQVAAELRPRMMALNIHTYLNLYGYGYRNVYELNELVKVTDPRIQFDGSIVNQKSPLPETEE